jgi:hypothetical protein
MKAPMRPSRETAENLAIRALGFIAGEPDRLVGFLNMTGIAAADIRAAAREPRFLAGVLEHMLGNEGLLIAFAADAGIDPAEVGSASAALGGSEQRDVP